ncbi:MAG: hypothetical protein KKA07_13285 [Bacteroidetes bacterium]|nr:hypothetical protein [Bacteroidota bacterium]MBU1720033.1 hypothetical protein [Bacteroidota bacterium]
MKIRDQISKHQKELKLAAITRKVAKGIEKVSRGYIVDRSGKLVVLQETEDFRALGFVILPVDQMKKIKSQKHDGYYDKIMELEKEKERIGMKTEIELKNWKTAFKTFQSKRINVIVECEDPKRDSFSIGPVTKVTDKGVSIRHFDAEGFLAEKPTRIKYKDITKVVFDDRYVDVFSRYVREKKRPAENKEK